jgi:hypothetical protein
MTCEPFAYGTVIGIAGGLLLSVATTARLKTSDTGANLVLVNFGPAILGSGVFALEILSAVIALVAGIVFAVHCRWKPRSLSVVGWFTALFY